MKLSHTGKTIVKNAGALMASQLVTWSLSVIITVFLSRYLGPAGSGQLVLANSIWAVMAILIAFGMDTVLTKEIARNPVKVSELLSITLLARTLLFCCALGLVTLYLALLHYSETISLVVYIVGLSYLFWAYVGAAQAGLQGLQQMQYISLGNIVGKIVWAIVSLLLILTGQSIYLIAAVLTLGALITFLIQFYFLLRLQKIRLHAARLAILQLLRAGAPYFVSGLVLAAYGQGIVLLISLLLSERAVGWYGAANQLANTSVFLPTILLFAVFPILSRGQTHAAAALTVFRKSFDLLFVLGIPIGLGLCVLANPLVLLLYGSAFAPSGPILAVLGLVLILTYQNILIGQFLISLDRQNVWTLVLAVAAIATVLLDWFLLPWCQANLGNGGIGAAIGSLTTESGIFVLGFALVPGGALTRSNAWVAGRALVAGLGFVAAAWWLRDFFIVIPAFAGGITYLVLLVVFQVVTPAQLVAGVQLAVNLVGSANPLRRQPTKANGFDWK